MHMHPGVAVHLAAQASTPAPEGSPNRRAPDGMDEQYFFGCAAKPAGASRSAEAAALAATTTSATKAL